MELETYLSTEQVADLLKVKELTVKSWRTRKTYPLKYIRLGRLLRYRRSDVDEFMKHMAEIIK
jgi:excisionase family DNA binding protein